MSERWSHHRHNVWRRQKRYANQLSQRELEADEIHDILRELKQEVHQTKELQRKWEDDDKRESVEDDYKYHARQIVRQAEALRSRLELPSENVKELNEINRLKTNIRSLEKRLKEAGRFDDRERHFSSDSRETGDDVSKYTRTEVSYSEEKVWRKKRISERLINKQDDTTERRREPKLEALHNELETMRAEKASLEDANRSLIQEKQQLVENIEQLKKNLADKEYENKELSERAKNAVIELNKARDYEGSLTTQIKQQQQMLADKEEEVKILRGKRLSERAKNAVIELNKARDYEGSLTTQIKQQQQMLADKEEEVKILRGKRYKSDDLSKEDIDELSDPHRPMKLAEKVSELYDNQWTNAMENLEDLGLDDDENIQLLLKIFTESYKVCREAGDRQLEPILSGHDIALPDIGGIRQIIPRGKFERLSSEISEQLKAYRKRKCDEVHQYISQVMIEKFKHLPELSDEKVKACEDFIRLIVKYTWMMVIQDPPVHIEWEFHHGDEFDNNKLRSYTKGGNYLDFMVWPVLYLHEGGPLLAKGVAQGMKH